MFSFLRRLLPALSVLALLGAGIAHAAEPVNTLEKGLFGFKASGVAIRGYDTVAYWTENRPVEGDENITSDYTGATWRFASADNKALFDGDPEKYAPQYGGYCAYGVAKDGLVKIEPENFTILDGKLYLNYDDGVQGLWEADIPDFIRQADRKFEGLLAAE